MKIPVTLAVLTWNAPETLENTLKSYKQSGLLDNVAQKIIFIQANGKAERDIAKKYGFDILYSKENIGIQSAYRKLLNTASEEFFLFCENDWMCIENDPTSILKDAIELIEKHNVKCVRLRHKYHYGEPLHTLQFMGNELKQPSHFLDCIHWIEDPSVQYPDYAKKFILNNRNWFLAKSANANYTNNPCLYKTDWIRKITSGDYSYLLTDEDKRIQENYAKTRGINPAFIIFESCIQRYWEQQDFIVAQGIGLFKHNPVLKSKTEYNLIVSIGSGCSCSHHLRANKLQFESLPFDWVTNNAGLKITKFFRNKFADWCLLKNLTLAEITNNKYHYQDKLNNIVFVHDFSENISTEYKDVYKKYKRRIKRLLHKLKLAKSVLFVYETPNKDYKESDLYDFVKILKQKYRHKSINLLYLIHDETAKEPVYIYLNSNITIVNFDNCGTDWTGNTENWNKILCKYKLKEQQPWYKRLLKHIKKLG